jgi:hypothetical protein
MPLPLGQFKKDTACIRHTVKFQECENFHPNEMIEYDFEPVGAGVRWKIQPEPTWKDNVSGRVHVYHTDGKLKVRFIGTAAGAPHREDQFAFSLSEGQWGRVISNGRFTTAIANCATTGSAWWYEKWVINVAFLTELSPDMFLTRPDYTFKSLARLR